MAYLAKDSHCCTHTAQCMHTHARCAKLSLSHSHSAPSHSHCCTHTAQCMHTHARCAKLSLSPSHSAPSHSHCCTHTAQCMHTHARCARFAALARGLSVSPFLSVPPSHLCLFHPRMAHASQSHSVRMCNRHRTLCACALGRYAIKLAHSAAMPLIWRAATRRWPTLASERPRLCACNLAAASLAQRGTARTRRY